MLSRDALDRFSPLRQPAIGVPSSRMPTPFESRWSSSFASSDAPVASPSARGPGPAVARRSLPSLSRPGATVGEGAGAQPKGPIRSVSDQGRKVSGVSRRVGGDLEAGDASRAVRKLGGGFAGDTQVVRSSIRKGRCLPSRRMRATRHRIPVPSGSRQPRSVVPSTPRPRSSSRRASARRSSEATQ
jgi:hypothetical protein